jgi:hypothetical protein
MQAALPARREALRGVPDGLQPGQERAAEEDGMSGRKPYRITPQQTMDDRWIWWITAPNNVTVARSCRKYTTERGAVQGAINVLAAWKTSGIEVIKR